MNINEFKDDYLNELLDKLIKENKNMFLLGDFNINLLNYDIHPPTNEFLDFLSSHCFLPHILQPSRVTTNCKTLIDDIFSNMAVPNIISGNLTVSILCHLPQFLVAPNIFLMPLTLNPIIMKKTGQDLIRKILKDLCITDLQISRKKRNYIFTPIWFSSEILYQSCADMRLMKVTILVESL